TLCVQDFSQLRKDYGKEQADVIMNITGNINSGQATGDTAKQLSERFGKIMQDRASYSINSSDTSISRSKQLEAAIPPSKIASLSSGEFVGMVADNPGQKIELKAFHCQILNNHAALKKEQEAYKEIPAFRKLDNAIIQRNYLQIRQDVQDLVQSQMALMLNDPGLKHLVIKKFEY
ncbi:MAG: conjugal transfer protein TraG, partial [Chitinophagaceae bacterium]